MYAYGRGVRGFVADAAGEIDKLPEPAPGSAAWSGGHQRRWLGPVRVRQSELTEVELVRCCPRTRAAWTPPESRRTSVASSGACGAGGPDRQAAVGLALRRRTRLRPRCSISAAGFGAGTERRCRASAGYRRAVLGAIERHFVRRGRR